MSFHLPLLPSQLLGLLGLFGLILLDTLLGVILAIRGHRFSWSALGGFTTNILKHVGSMLATAVMANGAPSLAQVSQPAWWAGMVAIATSVLFGDISTKIKALEALAAPATSAASVHVTTAADPPK